MKRLIRMSESITHRDIPMQFDILFPTYDEMLINNGEIEQHNPENFPTYEYNNPVDNMEWRLKDER